MRRLSRARRVWTITDLLLAICALRRASALDNTLAKTPPLAYACPSFVNESFVRSQADLVVSKGLKAAGYQYVIVQDGWSNRNRSAKGELEANSTSFPSGMKALADYLHTIGLKFGLSADAGNFSCGGHPGSQGFETIDAQTFAGWGVDYIKYDYCALRSENQSVANRFTPMSNALNKTGRPVVYSILGQGLGDPWTGWGPQTSNLWRIDAPIAPDWSSMLRVLDNSVSIMKNSGPSAWADLDVLQVGAEGLTLQEKKVQFALWALLKSPLVLSGDLDRFTEEELKLVKNQEVIAVNQDAAGVPGDQVWKRGPYEVYAAPLQWPGGSRAVCVLNRHVYAAQYPVGTFTIGWTQIGFSDKVKVRARNILDGALVGTFQNSLKITVSEATNSDLNTRWMPWKVFSYNTVSEAPKLPKWARILIVVLSLVFGFFFIIFLAVLLQIYGRRICTFLCKIIVFLFYLPWTLVYLFFCCGCLGRNGRYAPPPMRARAAAAAAQEPPRPRATAPSGHTELV